MRVPSWAEPDAEPDANAAPAANAAPTVDDIYPPYNF